MPRLCQLCRDKHQAMFRCEDCEEDMCELAKSFHQSSKATKNHRIIELIPESGLFVGASLLPPLPPSALFAACNSVCPLHHDSFRYYDEICKVRICRDCFALDHNGHRCVSIEAAVMEKRRCCETEYVSGCRKMEEYEREIAETRKAKEMLDKEYSEMKAAIKAEMSQIIRAAEERERALLARADELYETMMSSFASTAMDAGLIEKKLQAALEERKRALDVDIDTMSTATAAARDREANIAKANEWFVLFDSLLPSSSSSEDKESDAKGAACCKALEGWREKAKISYVKKDESVLACLLSGISSLGEIVDGNVCAGLSVAEGEGLRVYEQREAQFEVLSYYCNGSRKMSGGDAIGLVLGEKDEGGKALSEFERSIQANIVDDKNGLYRVSYRTVASGLEGKIPLHVKLNGRDVKDSPFTVQFRSALSTLVPLRLTAGNNYSISADGRKGEAVDDNQAWCELNPLPKHQKIELRVTHNISFSDFLCLRFFPVGEVVDNNNSGSGNYGTYCWYVNAGVFYVKEKECYRETNSKKKNAKGKLTVLLTDSSLSCSVDDDLVYTFPAIEPNNYKMIIDTYYNSSSVSLL